MKKGHQKFRNSDTGWIKTSLIEKANSSFLKHGSGSNEVSFKILVGKVDKF
jgi:hypothetical protein